MPRASGRWTGVLLFLPVPAVLFLFTQAPLGVRASLALGVALVFTHRLYARPWALRGAAVRCLWCAGPAAAGAEITVDEPPGRTAWRCCGPAHEQATRRFLGWVSAHRRFVQAGILGALAVFLALAGWSAWRPRDGVAYSTAVDLFRLGVALTVLPVGLLAGRRPPDAAVPRTPFPVHIQALVGTRVVVWLFRLVGAAWLVLAAWRLSVTA